MATAGSIIVQNPNTQTVKFAGKYINLSEISRNQGIDTSYLSRIFRGERMPTVPYIRKISAALGMEVQQFLDALDLSHKNLTK